jgi:hypothetical protein
LIRWLIQRLREENDLSDIKRRYKEALIIQFAIVLSIPYLLAFTFPYQGYVAIDLLRGNYGLVTILGIPIYLLIRSFKKDKVHPNANVVYLITSWNFGMFWLFDKVISDWYLSIDLPNILSANFPIFESGYFYELVVDLTLAPPLVLYALFTYLIMVRILLRCEVAVPKNKTTKN